MKLLLVNWHLNARILVLDHGVWRLAFLKLTPGPGLFIFRKIVEQDEEEEISSSSSFEDLASEIVKED